MPTFLSNSRVRVFFFPVSASQCILINIKRQCKKGIFLVCIFILRYRVKIDKQAYYYRSILLLLILYYLLDLSRYSSSPWPFIFACEKHHRRNPSPITARITKLSISSRRGVNSSPPRTGCKTRARKHDPKTLIWLRRVCQRKQCLCHCQHTHENVSRVESLLPLQIKRNCNNINKASWITSSNGCQSLQRWELKWNTTVSSSQQLQPYQNTMVVCLHPGTLARACPFCLISWRVIFGTSVCSFGTQQFCIHWPISITQTIQCGNNELFSLNQHGLSTICSPSKSHLWWEFSLFSC